MKEIKKKVLFDSNILIDVLTQREDSADSIASFIKMVDEEFYGYICAKQITDIYYVLKKYLSNEKRLDTILKLISVFNILDLKRIDLEHAFEIGGKDYEDQVLVAVAERNGIDYILSKDKNLISNSMVEIISPSFLLNDLA